MRRLLPFLLAALAVAAAVLAANLVLLDRAGATGDDLGSLSPVQPALASTPGHHRQALPPPTTSGGADHGQHDHAEDDD